MLKLSLLRVVLFKKSVLIYILLTFHEAFLFKVEKLCLSTFCIFVMLNHHCTINESCTIINFDRVIPSVRLFYTVRLLIPVVIPLCTIKRPSICSRV